MKKSIIPFILLLIMFSCQQTSENKVDDSSLDFKLSEFQNACDFFYAEQKCGVALLDYQKLLRSKNLSLYTDLPQEDYKKWWEIYEKKKQIHTAMKKKYTKAEIAECELFKKLQDIDDQFKSQRSELLKKFPQDLEARGKEEEKLFEWKVQQVVEIINGFK